LQGVSSLCPAEHCAALISAFATQLVQSLLQGGHGGYVAQHYSSWMLQLGLQLDSAAQSQLLVQAGVNTALPLLMAGVPDGSGHNAAATTLRAVLQVATSKSAPHSERMPALLQAATQLLASDSMRIEASLFTAALQAAAHGCSSDPGAALALAQAAIHHAAASNIELEEEGAAACIILAADETLGAQWRESLEAGLDRLPLQTAAAWYQLLLVQGAGQLQAHSDTYTLLASTLSSLLTSAIRQEVSLESGTAHRLISSGLAAATQHPNSIQLAVQAATLTDKWESLRQVLDHMSSAERKALALALIEAQQYSLALQVTRNVQVLTHLLQVACGQQLPPDVLRTALEAAVSADRPDLVAGFLQAQVLVKEGAELMEVVGQEPGLVRLCSCLLSSRSSTAQQHQQQGSLVVGLVQRMVAGVRLSEDTWHALLEATVNAAKLRQSEFPQSASVMLQMCRLAAQASLTAADGSAPAKWHLHAAIQLAAVQYCVPLSVACLQASVVSRPGP
jgi:hypothetical protein